MFLIVYQSVALIIWKILTFSSIRYFNINLLIILFNFNFQYYVTQLLIGQFFTFSEMCVHISRIKRRQVLLKYTTSILLWYCYSHANGPNSISSRNSFLAEDFLSNFGIKKNKRINNILRIISKNFPHIFIQPFDLNLIICLPKYKSQ